MLRGVGLAFVAIDCNRIDKKTKVNGVISGFLRPVNEIFVLLGCSAEQNGNHLP